MDANGVGLNDVIGGGIGRLPTDGRVCQGLGCDDDGYLDEWGAEPEDTETVETQHG